MIHFSSQKPTLWEIMSSTTAAAFGVQSQRNQERDFKHGSIYVYIASGLLFTAIFVVIIALGVKAILSYHGL